MTNNVVNEIILTGEKLKKLFRFFLVSTTVFVAINAYF